MAYFWFTSIFEDFSLTKKEYMHGRYIQSNILLSFSKAFDQRYASVEMCNDLNITNYQKRI